MIYFLGRISLSSILCHVLQVKLVCKDDRRLSHTSSITQAARDILQGHGVQPAWAVIELAVNFGKTPGSMQGQKGRGRLGTDVFFIALSTGFLCFATHVHASCLKCV